MSDKIREAFEAWHRSKFATKYSSGQPTRDMHNGVCDDEYGPQHQQQMWEAWQAALAQQPAPTAVPTNCRQRLMAEGKPFPKSSCAACGQFSPKWRECDAMLAAAPAAPVVVQEPAAIGADEADDLIAVRRGLIAAACSAIDKKRDAPKTLAQLRNLAVHGFSLTGNAPPAAEQPECGCCGQTGPCDLDCDCAEQPDTVKVPRGLLRRAYRPGPAPSDDEAAFWAWSGDCAAARAELEALLDGGEE